MDGDAAAVAAPEESGLRRNGGFDSHRRSEVGSSAWREHRAEDSGVAGSNPAPLANRLNRGFFEKPEEGGPAGRPVRNDRRFEIVTDGILTNALKCEGALAGARREPSA